MQVFTDLAAKVRPRDVFVFFAAGHGKTLDGRYYFIPHDLRYHTDQSLMRDAIGQDKLQAWFARILAKKAVLMFDTCEAGSLTERGKTRGGLEQKAALGRLIQATGRATLTASTATQEAYEGHGGHGVFTFALLDALARGDPNSNGLIELAELIQHVDGLVPAITEKRWGAKQFPQMDAYGVEFRAGAPGGGAGAGPGRRHHHSDQADAREHGAAADLQGGRRRRRRRAAAAALHHRHAGEKRAGLGADRQGRQAAGLRRRGQAAQAQLTTSRNSCSRTCLLRLHSSVRSMR